MSDTPPTILVADDDPDIREILMSFLSEHECEVLEAPDGASALEEILVHQPNLVILDVMMPELSGWEICKYVRSKPELSDVRILMLTAIGKSVNEATAPLFGADAYLDKPFQLDDLEATVRSLLQGVGHALSPRPLD